VPPDVLKETNIITVIEEMGAPDVSLLEISRKE
jgi:hypothetical protein